MGKGPRQHRPKDPVRLSRCVSNSYERKRSDHTSIKAHKGRPADSTDYHLNSAGLLTVNPNAISKKTSTTQTEEQKQQVPPLPPPLPQTATPQQKTLNKPPLNKQSLKAYQAPLPLPPNYTTYLTPGSTPNPGASGCNKGRNAH